MQNNSKKNLFDIIDRFKDYSILVIGDIILDEYIWGKASRLSPEAPVPVLEVEKYSYILGGAANVANNIRKLGGKVFLAGVIGEDSTAEKLLDILEEKNIDKSCIISDKTRPTTVKTRLVTHNHHQLVRFDREIKNAISIRNAEKILNKVEESIDSIDMILLSDYSKGVITPELSAEIIKFARKKDKPVFVDPKGLDFSKYSGATLITPNRLEAETATKSPSGETPEVLAKKLKDQLEANYVMVTLGEDGILLYAKNEFTQIPAVTSEVYDVTGAGDSLISGISLAYLASGFDMEVSMTLGNYAAGVAVRKIGTTTVSPAELKNIIEHAFMDSESKQPVLKSLMKTRLGVTLAELLLALTIIGVITSLTIPSFIANVQNQQYTVGIKKAYGLLGEATKRFQDNYGEIDFSTNDNALAEYQKVFEFVDIENAGTERLYPQIISCYKGDVACDNNAGSYAAGVLPDGSVMLFFNQINANCAGVQGGLTTICSNIAIDINGKKNPNMVGIDYFEFWLIKKSENFLVVPIGSNNDGFICSSGSAGWNSSSGCTSYVLSGTTLP